jgi:lipoate-protein ligase A
VLEVTAPALVLGSAQPATDARDDAPVDVVRRRTGGGAVYLAPGECTWVDVTVPRDDPLHLDDVGRAFHWLGSAWAGALRALGVEGLDVHTGAPVTNEWSSQICFAGVGSGEVVCGARKLVGLSQRRTRSVTRFQSIVLHRWDPDALLALVAVDRMEGASTFLHEHVATVDVAPDAVVSALLAALP